MQLDTEGKPFLPSTIGEKFYKKEISVCETENS